MLKNILIVAGIVAICLAFIGFHSPSALFGSAAGTEHYFQENFYGGLTLGKATYSQETASNCATGTWNPSAVGSSTDATLDVGITGYTQGDSLSAQLATSTQGLVVTAVSTSTANTTATIVLFDPDNTGTPIDIGTTTYKACFTHRS